MTSENKSWLLIVMGLTVAAFSVVIGARLRANDAAPPEAAPEAAVVAPTTLPNVLETVAQPTEIHVETPPPAVDGLSEAVVRVLASRGFAEFVGTGNPSEELPESVVQVLGSRGVTLHVAEEPAP